ncbi:type IV pilin protein [Endozoicomonas sp. 8E]|uniref:type IV pilin protein n=1 Tax=Endozoicomonas sp. 8E TaxID=3035692 RepID=UPI0029390ADC|nr:type IV pilin protein [Endozoicomonas sp. 8E]WOG26413.1 type IV pilin protein [Endozoicomonas sp. 8E]
MDNQPVSAKDSGFSLIELMIVVAIIGIIVAVAIPSYQQYVFESRRTDAHVALTTAAAEQEKFYTYDNAYTTDINNLGGATSPDGHYTIAVTATNTTYTLTATAISSGSQYEDTDCRTITLNQLGVRAGFDSSAAASAECW